MLRDRVPQARLYLVWNTPQWGTEEDSLLSIAGQILSSGKTSRLYKRLVYDDQIATDASADAGDERDRLHLLRAGVGAPGRRRRAGGEGDPGGARALPPEGAHAGRARARPHAAAGDVHPRRRAGGRPRRQVGRPRRGAGLRRRSGLLQEGAGVAQGGHPGPRRGGGSPLALRRRVRPHGGALPGAGRRQGARRSREAPRARHAAGREASAVRAGDPLQRAAADRRAPRRPCPSSRSACWSTPATRPTRAAPLGPRSSPPRCSTRGPRTRSALQISDALQRLGATLSTGANLDQTSVEPLGAEGQPGRVAGDLRGRGPQPGLPAGRLRAAQEAAARRHRAGERAADQHRDAGPARARLRRRPRVREPAHRLRDAGARSARSRARTWRAGTAPGSSRTRPRSS